MIVQRTRCVLPSLLSFGCVASVSASRSKHCPGYELCGALQRDAFHVRTRSTARDAWAWCMQDVIAWSHACRPQQWRAMRDIAYQNIGLVHKPAKELEPMILFIDGKQNELRSFSNVTQLLPGLQEQFPEAKIRYVQISTLSGDVLIAHWRAWGHAYKQ